ncbi:IS3 family transposase [Amycolatopsis sp. BJA-103]|uniref:IS3 family transposase n=1 Tax=Amycolatopsis sp. BJA-103 TaxID=1911175 RepID=UPI000CBAC167|nr:IS3 family transposase [Amycolatopsis sp. BJA-103]PNE20904.1 hypothetical protein B1H26_03470 [Amycolatopsis sp. BJA-103]
MHRALREAGWRIAKKTVLKLMRELGLACPIRRRRRYVSCQGEVGKVADNILSRQFTATAPNQKMGHRHHRVPRQRPQTLLTAGRVLAPPRRASDPMWNDGRCRRLSHRQVIEPDSLSGSRPAIVSFGQASERDRFPRDHIGESALPRVPPDPGDASTYSGSPPPIANLTEP